jgi:tripartite ATP-independent transporter DctM subunit
VEPFLVALIGALCFLLLSVLEVPLGFAFITIGFVGVISTRGLGPGLNLLGSSLYSLLSSYTFAAIPLFILMGSFAFTAGIGRDLYTSAYKWLGKLPGGIALATMAACAGFGTCSGSTVAAAATMGDLCFPEMVKLRYHKGFSAAAIAAGSTLDIIIPPSNTFIIYGFVTDVSIGALFAAGFLPGLLLCLIFMLLILAMCQISPRLGPPSAESFSWKDKITSLGGVWGMVVLFGLVIGGMFFGVFAPSEAAAIGAFGSFILITVRRQLTRSVLITALTRSVRITCSVMFVIAGALVFNVFLGTSGFATAFTNWLMGLPVSRWVILVISLLIYIPLGAFMDELALMMLTLPIIAPVISGLGFDLVWYGILVTVMLQFGLLTPPIALAAYIVQGVTKVPLWDIYRSLIPFLIALLIGFGLLVAFPEITLLVPRLMPAGR